MLIANRFSDIDERGMHPRTAPDFDDNSGTPISDPRVSSAISTRAMPEAGTPGALSAHARSAVFPGE